MVEVLSHFLGFFIGFTLTLGIIGSILYYIKPDSRKSTYFIWDLLCERCKPWIFNLPEVDWNDFWVIPMTVEGFMGTLYYGTYSKDEVREIYESKGIGLI